MFQKNVCTCLFQAREWCHSVAMITMKNMEFLTPTTVHLVSFRHRGHHLKVRVVLGSIPTQKDSPEKYSSVVCLQILTRMRSRPVLEDLDLWLLIGHTKQSQNPISHRKDTHSCCSRLVFVTVNWYLVQLIGRIFLRNDLTNYFWGLSIFCTEDQGKLYPQKTRERTELKFSKEWHFFVYILDDCSVSQACYISQTVRWRFIYVNGTFHRWITKPFTGALYRNSQHLEPAFDCQVSRKS